MAARRTIDAALYQPPPAGADAAATATARAAQAETADAATFAAGVAATAAATRLTPAPTPTPDAAATQRAAASTATAVVTRLTPEPSPTNTPVPAATPNPAATQAARATGTAQVRATMAARSATARAVRLTATAVPRLTATAAARGTAAAVAARAAATATAQARVSATAQARTTATARATATAAARASATAAAEASISSRLNRIRAGQPSLYDDFAYDNGTWDLWSNEDAVVELAQSKLTIRVIAMGIAVWSSAQGVSAGDLLFEADVVQRSGPTNSDSGLIFRGRFQDGAGFYFFTVDGDGNYRLGKSIAGGWDDVLPWTPSGSVKIGLGVVNRLSVLAEGPKITMLVNGEIVAQVEDNTFSAGELALGVADYGTGGARISFDNVSLWILD